MIKVTTMTTLTIMYTMSQPNHSKHSCCCRAYHVLEQYPLLSAHASAWATHTHTSRCTPMQSNAPKTFSTRHTNQLSQLLLSLHLWCKDLCDLF